MRTLNPGLPDSLLTEGFAKVQGQPQKNAAASCRQIQFITARVAAEA